MTLHSVDFTRVRKLWWPLCEPEYVYKAYWCKNLTLRVASGEMNIY